MRKVIMSKRWLLKRQIRNAAQVRKNLASGLGWVYISNDPTTLAMLFKINMKTYDTLYLTKKIHESFLS